MPKPIAIRPTHQDADQTADSTAEQVTRLIITGSMAVVCTCAGVVLYLLIGLSALEAALAALVLFSGLFYLSQLQTTAKPAVASPNHLEPLSSAISDLAQRLGEMGIRLNALEQATDNQRVTQDTMRSESVELSGLVQALADELAHQELRFIKLEAQASQPTPRTDPQPYPQEHRITPPAPVIRQRTQPIQTKLPEEEVVLPPISFFEEEPEPESPYENDILDAIKDNRIELYLQPIVTLPQRKVRFYEAFSKLYTRSNDKIDPDIFIPLASKAGLMPQVENFILYRSIQLVRRLQAKNREIGMFCNLSEAALSENALLLEFADFISANPELGPLLILEISQNAWRNLGNMELETLQMLAAQGLQLSIDQISDLRFDPRQLSEQGVRFLKVPADFLLNSGIEKSDIHPADLKNHLSRYNIDLIVSHVESEATVVDILDFEIQYGQGFLFGAPRPVRPDATKTTSAEPAQPPQPNPTPSQPVLSPADLLRPQQSPKRKSDLAALARTAVRRA